MAAQMPFEQWLVIVTSLAGLALVGRWLVGRLVGIDESEGE